MKIETLKNAPFGASVSEFDCARCKPEEADSLRAALLRHQLLAIPGQQHLSPQQEVAFCRAIDVDGGSVWRDQVNNPWEVFKVEQGNQAGTYQIPDEPGVLVLGKGDIDHYGLKVTLGGKRDAYGGDRGSQVLGGGGLQWHIDGTFYEYPPCHVTQMRCIEAPAGDGHWLDYDDGSGERLWCAAGATAFASGRVALDLLSPEDRQICNEIRVHYFGNPFQTTYRLGNTANGLRAIDESAEQAWRDGGEPGQSTEDDPLAQVLPLVWNCELTGQSALMPHPRCLRALEINTGCSRRLLGLVESRRRVESWMRPAISPDRVYVHAWRPGDLVLWNNRSVWHSATGGLSRNDRRVMHLTAFNGTRPPAGP